MQKDHNSAEHLKERLTNKLDSLKSRIESGETIPNNERIQVCVLADSPTVVTGFGNVCREILTALYDTGMYMFEIVGINYDGSPHDLPFKIYPAVNALMRDPAYLDPYGQQRYLDMLGEGRFDISWVLQDSFIVGSELAIRIQETNDQLPIGDQFAFIYYFPIDATPKKSWIDKSALIADIPVVYTRYGFDEIMKLYTFGDDTKLELEEQTSYKHQHGIIKDKLSVVYHGVNTKDFYPIDDEYKITQMREKLWAKHKDKFVFINVNRNQPRKDLYRTLQAFKILLDRRRAKGLDDVYLYVHCNLFDNDLNMLDMCKQLNLTEGDEFGHPDPRSFAPSAGFPVSVVNELYNVSDAVITTTLGEGWGLSITEGMACKKPIIAPDHTSISEILGRTNAGTAERGLLVKTKGEFVQQHDNSRARPITDAEDMADKMEMLVENRKAFQPMIENAYEWVKKLEWTGDEVIGKWKDLFEAGYKVALIRRAAEMDKNVVLKIKKLGIGRNEQCPACPDGTKIKHCRHGVAAGV